MPFGFETIPLRHGLITIVPEKNMAYEVIDYPNNKHILKERPEALKGRHILAQGDERKRGALGQQWYNKKP